MREKDMQQDAVPYVSVVIPTLNSGKTLQTCLQAITAQKFPQGRCEIVIADAGSTDDTLEIARTCGVDKIVENPLKTGEAGKADGIQAASVDIIALVDSDNILPDAEWLQRMVAPFDNPQIVASEPIAYTVRPEDPALTRYFALLGMNDPLCLFTRNYDRLCAITGTWTGLKVPQTDRGDYLELTLSEEALPTIGANGFVFRRSLLEHVVWSPYFFDIDVVHQAVRAALRRWPRSRPASCISTVRACRTSSASSSGASATSSTSRKRSSAPTRGTARSGQASCSSAYRQY